MNYQKLFLVLFQLYIFSRNDNAFAHQGEEIIGGTDAVLGEFPYQISLQLKGVHVCGGGILDPLYVVTAAHCVVNETTFVLRKGHMKVVGGVNALNSPISTKETSNVAQIFVHTMYTKYYQKYKIGDIAIVKLKRALNVGANPFLDYLELPAESEKFAGLTAVVSGYGATQLKLIHDLDSNTILKERVHSNKLHSAEALVLSNEDCKKKYMVADTRLCANIIGPSTDEIRGLCYGDSGSPLVVGKNKLIGIVSAGPPDCDESDIPGSYVKVQAFLPFIQAVLSNNLNKEIVTLIVDKQKSNKRKIYEENQL